MATVLSYILRARDEQLPGRILRFEISAHFKKFTQIMGKTYHLLARIRSQKPLLTILAEGHWPMRAARGYYGYNEKCGQFFHSC